MAVLLKWPEDWGTALIANMVKFSDSGLVP